MNSQKTSLTKNITYSKRGATITCPVCGKSATYQIGQLDREEWVRVHGKYRCKECRAILPYEFNPPLFKQEFTDDIDTLLEML